MSITSMTGFARAEGALGEWSWAIEVRSVNGRNLEVRFRGPAGLDGLERPAREAAQSRFQRGQINIQVQGRRAVEARRTRINGEALETYLRICESLVASGRGAPPNLDGLLSLPGVIETADGEEEPTDRVALEVAMAAGIVEALDALRLARQAEGLAIDSLARGFLTRMESLIGACEAEAVEQPRLIKLRFERRMAELAGDSVSSERITQEAAALAVRADVREELDRLVSHVGAARALLEDQGASGRRLDFLTQEFMREANTLCSKSASVILTGLGLDLKAVIDQFREQIQNVE
jgi:uncharacterized protein (TIGR00255 family)